MVRDEIIVGLRFSRKSLAQLRQHREDMITVQQALADKPLGLAAFKRFMAAIFVSPNEFFEVFQETLRLGETVIGELDPSSAKAGD